METLRRGGVVAILCLTMTLAGCGGSSGPTAAQSRACWAKESAAYVPALAGRGASATQRTAAQKMLTDDGALLAKGRLTAHGATPAIEAWLKGTQKKCGKLR